MRLSPGSGPGLSGTDTVFKETSRDFQEIP